MLRHVVVTFSFLLVIAGVTIYLIYQSIRYHGPQIDIDSQVVDLGTIETGKADSNDLRHITFKIRNSGSDVLRLTNIRFSCTCIEHHLDKDILMPGELTQLNLGLRIPHRIGEFQEHILLCSNDKSVPVTKLIVKGFVDRDCYVLPEALAINRLYIGEKRRVELEVTGPVDKRYFTVNKVTANCKEIQLLKAEKMGTSTGTSRCIWKIILFVESRGIETWEDIIKVSTNIKESPLLEIPIKVNELSPVSFDPVVVIFKLDTEEKEQRVQVEITANIALTMKIIDIEKPDWINLDFETHNNSIPTKLYLTMKYVPDIIKSNQNGIILKLGDGFGEVRIPILLLPNPESVVSNKSNVISDKFYIGR